MVTGTELGRASEAVKLAKQAADAGKAVATLTTVAEALGKVGVSAQLLTSLGEMKLATGVADSLAKASTLGEKAAILSKTFNQDIQVQDVDGVDTLVIMISEKASAGNASLVGADRPLSIPADTGKEAPQLKTEIGQQIVAARAVEAAQIAATDPAKPAAEGANLVPGAVKEGEGVQAD